MKRISNVIIILVLLFVGYNILVNSNNVMNVVLFGFDIWKNNIFPTLFPFFVLSELLINYGFVELLAHFFSPLMQKVFKIDGKTSFILFMSMLSGFPSNAKYVVELLNKNEIDLCSANKILLFTHFSNPLFIIGTLSIFLNSKKIAILILIVHYLTNFIIGLIFRNTFISKNNNCKFKEKIPKRFSLAFKDAIIGSIDTLLLILGTIITFLVITNIINNCLNLNDYFKTIINGMFEMTQGLKYVSITDFSLKVKSILSVMFLSFGGISVHMQVLSIISDTNLKYQPYLIARLLHATIAGILMYTLFNFV